jgi:non-lysosomal glucosylceramidase
MSTSTVAPERVAIPKQAWTRSLGQPFPNAIHPHVNYPMYDDGPFNGVPIGGMGAGAIGRTFRGDFARWHLEIGKHVYEPLPACMFSVYMESGGERVAQALFTGRPEGTLGAWQWDYPVGAGTYYALYPRAWFAYDWEKFPARLTCEQFSPIIPNNYRESSYPVGVFVWTAHNPTDAPITLGIMLSWQNTLGREVKADNAGGQAHWAQAAGNVRGVLMGHHGAGDQYWRGTVAIAAAGSESARVTTRTRWNPDGDGADLWADFAADGALDNADDQTPAAAGQRLGSAVCVTVTLAPGETREVPFALGWDMPEMQFGGEAAASANVGAVSAPVKRWYRRYTAFYGRSGNRAFDIAAEALTAYADWRDQIVAWQAPILADSARPDWYKTALFNELYFLTDGATAWEHGRVGEAAPPADYMGGYLYIECFDYPFYATFDVDFYASFALLELFPELEKRAIRDYIPTVVNEYPEMRPIIATGWKELAPRKLAGAVPHDLGGPAENPWDIPNYYSYQDVNRWKDLNPKFILRLYRDAKLLNAPELIREGWAACKRAIDYLRPFDRDGDGIPENEGIPDQTYDTWPVTGASAYSGSLWLAALAAMQEMANIMGDPAAAATYAADLARATDSYERKLWNGSYYNYDSSDTPYHDSIMADQLAGQWYMDYVGVSLLPAERVQSALKKVYDYNVLAYGEGQLGAVNGMRPDGTPDSSDLQSDEMWVGTAYGVAAFMLLRGLTEEGFQTAYGVYKVTYETSGMWFRTPEAYGNKGTTYRASMYMRPLAVWAMETALRVRK